jgi:hypothetical protein
MPPWNGVVATRLTLSDVFSYGGNPGRSAEDDVARSDAHLVMRAARMARP